MASDNTTNTSYDTATHELYQSMWSYIQTFPLADFIVEQNFKNWFDQMIEVGREQDVEFCVNYAKKFSGTKTYALLSEFENIKAWNINEQSIFTNARDVLENMFFVDTPEPANGDLLRGTRNEPFAREEFMSYLRDNYPAHQGYTIVQRDDLVKRLSTFDSEQFPWFGGTPDDIIEIRHQVKPSSFIMPDYKCPKPGNITAKVEAEYKHQLNHYDLGCDLLHSVDPTFPVIESLTLVKFNVETQAILVLESPKDEAYKARIVEACEMWWHEVALKGIIPPIQNAFTPIITAADFSDLQTKATDAVRLRDPNFKIDPDLEERMNAIPTLLYDFGIAKKITNEMGKLADDLNSEIVRSFGLLKESGVLPESGEFTLGCGQLKWQIKQRVNHEALLAAAQNIGIDVSEYSVKTISFDYHKAVDHIRDVSSNLGQGIDHATDYTIDELAAFCRQFGIDIEQFATVNTTVREKDLLKAVELHVRQNNIDVDLSHLFIQEDDFSIALSRKRSGSVASFADSLTADAGSILTKVLTAKEGYASHLILAQNQEFTDRIAYQSRSQKFSKNILSLLDDDNGYIRSPIPRPQASGNLSQEYGFVTFNGDIIEIDSGEIIGNIKSLNSPTTAVELNVKSTPTTAPNILPNTPTSQSSSSSGLQERQNSGRIIANIVIKSRCVTAEARGKAMAELEHRIDTINHKFGNDIISTQSTDYSSNITDLLGADFDLAREIQQRSKS